MVQDRFVVNNTASPDQFVQVWALTRTTLKMLEKKLQS